MNDDNAADRALGEHWEAGLGQHAAWHNKTFQLYQDKRHGASRCQTRTRAILLPDMQLFGVGAEYHDIKHKNPTKRQHDRERCYGLELYRLRHLDNFRREARSPVFYTIHDWEVAGAKRSDAAMPNLLQDWRIAEVEALIRFASQRLQPEAFETWLNGEKHTNVQGYYWPISLWRRLDLHWGLPE